MTTTPAKTTKNSTLNFALIAIFAFYSKA